MVKKNENILSLPADTSDFIFGPSDVLVPQNESSGVYTDKRKIQSEGYRQRVATDAISLKSKYVFDRVREIDQHANTNFISLVEHVVQNKEQKENTNCQPYIDEWSHRLIQVGAQQFLGIIKIASTAIAQEVARSPYPPIPDPDHEKPGFLQRLLG